MTKYNRGPNTVMPFGKYKNKLIKDIPTQYLLWVLTQAECEEGLRKVINTYLGNQFLETPANRKKMRKAWKHVQQYKDRR